LCHGRFPQLRWLELHVAERHDQFFKTLVKSGRKMYACLVDSCGRTFKNGKARRLHLVDFHHFPKSFVFDSVGRRPRPVPVLSVRRVQATAPPRAGVATAAAASATRPADTTMSVDAAVVSPAPLNRRARRALERERADVAARLAQGADADDQMNELQHGLMATGMGDTAMVAHAASAAPPHVTALATADMAMEPIEPQSPVGLPRALPLMVSPSTQAYLEALDDTMGARLDLCDHQGRRRRPQHVKTDSADPERARLLHALSGNVPIASASAAGTMDDADSPSDSLTAAQPALAAAAGPPLPRPAFVPRSVQRKAAAAASTSGHGPSR